MQEAEPISAPGPDGLAPRSRTGALLVLATMCATVAFGWLLGPYGAALSAVGLTMAPLAFLAVLVHVGADREWARGCALALLLALAALVVVMFVGQTGDLLSARHGPRADEYAGQIYAIAGVSASGVVLSLLLLAPWARRWLAGFLPIDAGSFAHAVAVSMAVTLIVSACAPLLVLGEPVITAAAAIEAADKGAAADPGDPAALFEQVYQLLWLVPVCLLAAGYGVRRDFRGALARLGLTWPTGRQVLGAVGLALLVAFVALVLGAAVNGLWEALGWAATDQGDVETLMGYMLTPVGALVVGVCAGLGEELLVRGVLQPRLGLVLSNTLFTAMHAGQYGWDMLLVIFFVGTAFGLVRKHSSTTVSALVHGLYDAVLILLAVSAVG